MLSVKQSLVVAALFLLIGQTKAAVNVTPIVAPRGAKVLTVGVIGGDYSDSIIDFFTNRCYRLWLDRLGSFSRSILLRCIAYFTSRKHVRPQRGGER